MGLDLYSRIEKYLDFNEETDHLHRTFNNLVLKTGAKTLLDVGCGQGKFLELISKKKSIKAAGIDLSQAQVNICKAKDLDVSCINVCDIDQKFECATAIFDVINYIPKDKLADFFKCIYTLLNKSGYFIFDINSLFGFDSIAQGLLVIDKNNKFITIDAVFENNSLKTDITLFTQNSNNLFSKEKDSIIQYYHDTQFLKNLLEQTGFEIKEIADFNLHSDDEADKLIFICNKSK